MRRGNGTLALVLLAASAAAGAQTSGVERVGFDSPEGWGMAYGTAPTLMTGFGAVPALAPGRWALSAELGHIPRLSEADQRVGFAGTKQEDLNKSPVFGRLRGWLGLPAGVVLELGWTPPLEIDGVQADDLFALALGRRLVERERWSLSVRAFVQHGSAHGDITCPRELAGAPLDINPFGCRAPSDDRIDLGHHGVDATLALAQGARWHWHASAGAAWLDPQVQVNAPVFDTVDRSRLRSDGRIEWLAIGATRDAGPWQLATELLYVPLEVHRAPGGGRDDDPFWSLRVMLRRAL